MIQVFSINGRLFFEFISDIADPVLKVNVEFPQAFWHNRGAYEDPLRDIKLEEYGWKVIRINSKSPSLKDIEEAIKGV
jgi:very-short-patch-repair endonuclease